MMELLREDIAILKYLSNDQFVGKELFAMQPVSNRVAMLEQVGLVERLDGVVKITQKGTEILSEKEGK